MSIHRRPCDKPFTKAMNDLIRSPNESALAKVVFWNIASHREDYQLTMAQLVAQVKEGRDAVRKAIKELEIAGRIARVQRRNERGAVTHSDFYIVDDPEIGLATGFQEAVTTSGNHESSQVATGAWFSGDGESGDGQSPPKKTSSKKLTLEEQEKSPLPPVVIASHRPSQGRDDGGMDFSKTEIQEREAARIVDRFIATMPVGTFSSVGRTRLVGAVGAALGRGCDGGRVVDVLGCPVPLGGVGGLAGVLAARVSRLGVSV